MTSPICMPHDWFPRPLPANVVLGEGSWLYSSFACLHFHSTRQPAVRIGRSTGVYDGSFFELGPNGCLEVGDFCTLVGAIVCTNQKVVIRDYVFIAHEVVIADHDTPAPARIGLRSAGSPRDALDADLDGDGEGDAAIVIGTNAWIGAGAIILAGARIGTGAIVGAATKVDFPVPDYAVVAGNPARVVAVRAPG